MPKQQSAISPTQTEDFPEWYQQAVRAADLAENSPVPGCMVIKPWGYALWENMQARLDAMFKETGHRNAYFPLLIPKSYLEREAEHVEGFAKECAVVTHHRLVKGPDGGLIPDPEAKLQEPFVIRPTSETIIGEMYARWVQSWRDLPILINQWANVMRWELRTRLFLRTTEFLWQEGHTAHETAEEAREETMKMLDVYVRFVEDYAAVPVIKGYKSPAERFAGAVDTYSIEAMMGDRKALQAGTSHFLGQNFAKACGIKFLGRSNTEEFAWTTSWGMSTRMIGAIVMTHGDDDGVVMPPRVAPAHVVIMPIVRDDTRDKVNEYVQSVAAQLRAMKYDDRPLAVEVDQRDVRSKKWDWIRKGVPVRLEIGARDVDGGVVTMARRDQESSQTAAVSRDQLGAAILAALDEIQRNCLERAKAHRAAHTHRITNKDDFIAFFTPKNAEKPEIHGGFAISPWCGGAECEAWAKKELKVTIRCIPLESEHEDGAAQCVICGKPATANPVFAKSY
ncbi:MAG TPA: proline--tRNA ligase [Thermoanaerobaculia bacterium]